MLQNIIGNAFRNAGLLCVTLILGVLIGCESPGSVGSGLTDSEADVVVFRDTIEAVTAEKFNSYTGDYAFFSAGGYLDPLFGEIKATGMIKPALPASGDTIEADATMKMRILFDSANVYGDTLADQSFDVYEINEYWRRQAFKLQDNIQIDESSKIASFTVGTEDSLEVTLDPAWVDENYRSYAQPSEADSTTDADSLYKNQEFGLALVPTNNGKIIPIDISSTRFVVENEEDTLEMSSNQWAFFMNRNNEPALPEGSVAAYNHLESTLNFDYDLTEIDSISGPSISRAELVFYQDEATMSQSISGSEKRPQATSAQLHLVSPDDQTLNKLVPGSPVANGIYSEDDQAFHFDVTSLIQSGLIGDGLEEGQEFYITLPNNGTVKSSLISIGPESVNPPELVITYLKNSQ